MSIRVGMLVKILNLARYARLCIQGIVDDVSGEQNLTLLRRYANGGCSRRIENA